jgi:hypothetical protein
MVKFLRRVLPRLIVGILGFVGMAFLFFVAGAAVSRYEQLPGSRFLDDAFKGGEAWWAKKHPQQEAEQVFEWEPTNGLDTPGQTCDGFTLYTVASRSQAVLVDMKGKEVHRWEISFSQVWPNPPHIKDAVQDSQVYFWGARLFPNGDLLAVLTASGDTPYGYGLVKLDKDSKIIWKYAGNVHHEIDIGDDGRIYALTHEIVKEVPKGLEWIPTPCLVDRLVVLSPEGEELAKVPILEAFRDSEYALLLNGIKNEKQQEPPPNQLAPPPGSVRKRGLDGKGDILHTNNVNVLGRKIAAKFPMFEAGQVLISLRELDTIAVVDIDRKKVVWAAQGPWRGQHSAQFVDNGHLILLDNHGDPGGSRVIEYDPRTQAYPWSVPKNPSGAFLTKVRGLVQRLSNGNTLIVESENGILREVTEDDRMVWYVPLYTHIASARRYEPEQAAFMKGTAVR